MSRIFAVLLVFAAVAFGQIQDSDSFSMLFEGHCVRTADVAGNCTMKANSQEITTLISAQDALRFRIKHHIGAFARWESTFDTKPDGSVIESGIISFGIHKAREHELHFVVEGRLKVGPNNAEWGSLSGSIIGGEGVFKGYTGIIVVTGAVQGEHNFALVSGHFWKA